MRSSKDFYAWLSYFFYPLLVRSPVAARASRGARAVLDGMPPPGAPKPAGASVPVPRIALPDDLTAIPLRLAAHVVTVGLVFVVLVMVSYGFTAGSVMSTLLSPSSARQAAPPDVQVARSLQPPTHPNAGDLSLPPARVPLQQFVLPFGETHLLAEGETLGQVAAQYHVNVADLFWANDLGSGNVFAAGQELRIPSVAGIPHTIEEGETLDSIAAQYNVSPEAIVLFKANGIREDQPLPIGLEIFIPGAIQAYPGDTLARFNGEQGIAAMKAVAAGTVQEADTNLRSGPGRDYPRLGTLDAGRRLKLVARHEAWVKVEDAAAQTGWVRGDLLGLSPEALGGLAETNDFPPPPPRWIWPTRGDLSSPFGWRSDPWRMFHDGIDIANAAGTKIYAARSGRVFEAGWCSGFGYCVKIDHGDGMTTIYGHMLRRPVVRVGDAVDAGDLIGLMGSTYDRAGGGYSTGVHLHFTVKINGKAVNPLKFLP